MEAILERIRAQVAATLQAARDLIATRPTTPAPEEPVQENNG